MISIKIPAPVREILSRLKKGGFEAFIVGGCVRDALLGAEPKDWDITTSALPEQVKSLFSNTADTGIQHGTVMVLYRGTGYEVTTYRVDGEYKDGRHPESVSFTASLEEDLRRRDFTINAFAYDPEEGITDLFDGMSDLENRVIRCVGDPDERFSEDSLRIMRAVRFSAQLSFRIEEKTLEAVRRHAPGLARVSMERIRVEFEKTLLSSEPEKTELYRELEMAQYLIPEKELRDRCFLPELSALYKEASGDPERVRILRLAFFFSCLTPEEIRRAMRKMKYDNKTIRLVSGIIQFKDRPLSADRRDVRRLLHETGAGLFDYLADYREAYLNAFAQAKEKECALSGLSAVRETKQKILDDKEAFTLSQLAVNGNDLIREGLAEGAQIGIVLNRLLEAVIEDPELNQKETLIRSLREEC